jgi:hypothetical protein
MDTFVTTFVLEEALIEELVGPFPDDVSALSWIDSKISEIRSQYPDYVFDRSEDNEFTMFSDADQDDPHGFVYQILPATTPVEVVQDGD